MTTQLDPETIKRASREKIARAMRHVENAQHELRSAQQELSALRGGVPVWKAAGKLSDVCHTFWYRLQRFKDAGKYSLDSVHMDLLRARIEKAAATQPR